MARESCNLDKDEAEILTPSSSSSSPTPVTVPPPPPPASSSPPSMFLKPASVHEFTAQRAERQEVFVAVTEPVTEKKLDKEERPLAVRFANRCTSCRKKVGLTGFRCRCGELFCPQHRYSDTHDCSFDYKAAGREEISKNNPLIRAAKIIKI